MSLIPANHAVEALRLLEEVEPPCEGCDLPAEFVVRMRCRGCDRLIVMLGCTAHETYWVRVLTDPRSVGMRYWAHADCGGVVVYVSTEPLR